MYERAADALGVPGEVLVIERKDKREIIKEVRDIMDKYPGQKLDDIPEGNEKERLRDLFRALGFEVAF
jgi:hypothetical protein